MEQKTDTNKIILDVRNLNTTFISDKKEIRIVKNVSFQLKRGSILAVVGESGCGKSVTMNSIMRFTGRNAVVKADKIQYNARKDGKITEYHLESITNPNGPEMRALRGPDMSMVFQDPMSSLNPVYKVGDQVAEGLIQHTGMSKKEVVQELGRPDSFYKENNLEVFKYTNRLMSGWNWNRADYYAKFENDKLVEYGTQKIREHGNPLSSINIYHTEN